MLRISASGMKVGPRLPGHDILGTGTVTPQSYHRKLKNSNCPGKLTTNWKMKIPFWGGPCLGDMLIFRVAVCTWSFTSLSQSFIKNGMGYLQQSCSLVYFCDVLSRAKAHSTKLFKATQPSCFRSAPLPIYCCQGRYRPVIQA